jgi:hypothetical protein
MPEGASTKGVATRLARQERAGVGTADAERLGLGGDARGRSTATPASSLDKRPNQESAGGA